MARIKKTFWVPFLSHCQGEVHTHLIVTRGGEVRREGQGLGLWFYPIGTSISEVPVNDQSVAVTFKCRSQDFQEVSITAQIWYMVTDPQGIARRFDFSLNIDTGTYHSDPLTVIQGALTSAAQEAVWSYVSGSTLESLLQSGLSALSEAVSDALSGLDFGICVSRAVVTAVRPEREVEEALQAKTRERLQMEADAAGFERRAKATEEERAIQEAELANRLALARQREELIEQEASNARSQAMSAAEVMRVEASGQAESETIREESSIKLQKARDRVEVEHQQELAGVRVKEMADLLSLHMTHPGAAHAVALTQLPEGLSNVRVLTIGEAGLQGVVERLVSQREGE